MYVCMYVCMYVPSNQKKKFYKIFVPNELI